MNFTIELCAGKDVKKYLELVSKFRIKLFAKYPYLYKGDLEYEKKYIDSYANNTQSTIAAAKIDQEIIGLSTGIPLISESEILSEADSLFKNQHIDPKKIYYYGEIMVLPKFRGHNISSRLLNAQDELIKTWGYTHVSLLTVVREKNHPLQPINYKSTDIVWEKMGYHKTGLQLKFYWPTFQNDGTIKEEDHVLELWLREINVQAKS